MVENNRSHFINLVRDFWLQLREKPMWLLAGQDPVYLLFYCDHGKHRSVAAAFLFAWILLEEGYQVNHTDNYVIKFNKWHWRQHQCGHPNYRCPECDRDMMNRNTLLPHYHDALAIFRQQRQVILGF